MYRCSITDHGHISALADKITAMVGAGGDLSAADIAKARLDFCRLVNQHNAADLDALNALDPAVKARCAELLTRFEEGLREWHHASIEFNSLWPLARLKSNSADFAAGFGDLIARLRARMQWEETCFYPRLSSASGVAVANDDSAQRHGEGPLRGNARPSLLDRSHG